MSHPRLGERVFYTLTADDAAAINELREGARVNLAGAHDGSGHGPGYVAHKGNHTAEGDQYPATLVANFRGPVWNLQVTLDGTDTYWATSRSEGDGPGFWQTRPSLPV